MDQGQIFAWCSVVVVLGMALYLAHAVSRSVIIGVPPDYFSSEPTRHGLLNHAVRTGFGAMLVICGVLMLALPGPGVVTILAGILVMDGPAKRAVVHRLFAYDRVRTTVDRLRRRAGQPPLVQP